MALGNLHPTDTTMRPMAFRQRSTRAGDVWPGGELVSVGGA